MFAEAMMAGAAAIGSSVAVVRRLGQARERRRVHRAIRRVPALSPTIPEGSVVRVTGVVRTPQSELIAPLSGARCVLYRSTATSSFWVGTGNRYESFAMGTFLVDGGAAGIALIVSEHAMLDAPSRPAPPDAHRRLRFLAIHGQSRVRDAMGNSRSRGGHRFHESLVREGDQVTVVGLLMRATTDGPTASEVGYRDAHLETRIVGNRAHPVQVRVHAA